MINKNTNQENEIIATVFLVTQDTVSIVTRRNYKNGCHERRNGPFTGNPVRATTYPLTPIQRRFQWVRQSRLILYYGEFNNTLICRSGNGQESKRNISTLRSLSTGEGGGRDTRSSTVKTSHDTSAALQRRKLIGQTRNPIDRLY